jgi:CheY-like chemotaxis protein
LKDGFGAPKYLKIKIAIEDLDLVNMDVPMSEMDGLETTRIIRKRERELGRLTPIIALTAHAMKEHESLCLEAGMNDFISKPIEIPRFLSKINEHLKKTFLFCWS